MSSRSREPTEVTLWKQWRAELINQNSRIPSHAMETKEILVRQRGRTVSREKTEWKEATPPSSSISPGTSSTPHFIWNAVLSGIADAFLRVCWLFRHMLCLIIQSRKSRSWKKTDSLKQRCSSLLYASLCGGRQAADQCDNCWKKRSEVTKLNWRHHGIAMCCSHPDPSTCPSP